MEITLHITDLENLYTALSKNEHAKDKNAYLKFNIYGIHIAERFDDKETFSEVVEGYSHTPEEGKILDMSESWIYLDNLEKLINDVKNDNCVGIVLRTNATCAFVTSWEEGEAVPSWYVDDFIDYTKDEDINDEVAENSTDTNE